MCYKRLTATRLLIGVIFNLIWLPLACASVDCTIQSDMPEAECEVLLALYNNTGGENWTDSQDNQWNLTETPCNWAGVTCSDGHITSIDSAHNNLVGKLPDFTALTALQTLILSNNQLSGAIPDLSTSKLLRVLSLENNQLSGFIPAFDTFSNLKSIEVQGKKIDVNPSSTTKERLMKVNLDYNKLNALDPILLSNLLILETQTIAPPNIKATALSASEIQVQLVPIPYTEDGGYYQVKYATSKGGPYTPAETTTLDKTVNIYVVENLSPKTTYYFVVETFTPPHGEQKNALTSDLSMEVSAMTKKSLGRPAYSSEPAPDSILYMDELGHSSTLIISEVGDDTLEVSRTEISGIHASDFQIIIGDAPFSILDGGNEHRLIVQCTPSEIGERTAFLSLTTNDPNYPTVTYPLKCIGETEPLGPVYSSEPAPNSTLDMGNNKLGNSSTTDLIISEVGNDTLEVSHSEISGDHASDFKIISGDAPFSILDGGDEHTLIVQCAPNEIRERTALLSLTTNDPNYPTVTYPLKCIGIGARYDSNPKPESTLDMGNNKLGHSSTTDLIILEVGNETLEVSSSEISGIHASDFQIISGDAPFSILDGGDEHILTVQCTPNEIGERTALLSLETNDPNYSAVTYPLICEIPIIKGEIHHNGEINNILSIDAPGSIKLIGYIKPTTKQINQPADIADIIATYRWQSGDNKTSLILPDVVIIAQKLLEQEMKIPLFEGHLIGLAGVFEVDLGYEIENGELFSNQIITLTVQKNKAPTDITLDGNTIAENSPPDTVIGTFSTDDDDQGDWFTYGLIENPEQLFKIVGNELRVGNGLSLDYETHSEHEITVRSVDATGDYLDKSFTIYLTDWAGDIRLYPQSVLEQSVNGTIVGRLVNDDPGNYVYELLDDADERFLLDNDLLRVADGKRLDFEKQSNHNITVLRQVVETEEVIETEEAVETADAIEKTFTVEVINKIDISILGEVRDITGTLRSTPITTTDDIQINVQLIPDIEHHGLEADVISLVIYLQGEAIKTYILDGETWAEWDDKYLLDLPIVKHLTLQESQNIPLFQGQLTEFAGGEMRFYVGYRLETGAFFYQPESINVILE